MSSVGNAYEDSSKIAYLATRTFENDLFSYTLTFNDSTYVRGGVLAAPIAGATNVTCPVGRFLYETGKKLIPGANPGVRTLMIGVFDPVSFLSGFIDPNSEVFTRMNEDKSAMLDTITAAGALDFGVFGRNPNGNTSDLADPVFTRGDVTALGQATITGDITSVTGNVAATVGNVTAGNNIVSANNITATTGNITATAGNVVATAGNVVAAKQIRSGFNATGVSLNFATGTLDYTIDIGLYASQNISVTATASGGSVGGCTLSFTSNGTAGDIIRLILKNTSGGNLTFDSGGNVKNSAAVALATSQSVFTYVSDGTNWILSSFVSGVAL